MTQKTNRTKRRGRPVSDEGGDTREKLLDAATRLFAEQGVAATSMSEIAADVGVTSAMIHYYFKTRDRLLDAIVDERIGKFIFAVQPHFDESADDPFAMVRGLVEHLIRNATEWSWLPPLWIREIASDGGQLRERMLKKLPVEFQKNLSTAIVAGQKRGTVNPDLNPQLFFVSIIGQTLFPLAVSKIWRRFPTLESLGSQDIIDHATSLLLFGLAGPQSKGKRRK